MLFAKLGGLAALAGVSQAFLIPPTITTEDSKLLEVVPFEASPDGRVMEVDCPGCPVEGAAGVLHQAESILRFNITIQHTNDQPDLLMANGLQIFPINAHGVMNSLVADQMIKKADGTWAYTSSPEVGYSMTVRPYHDDKQQFSVFGIHLRVIEVGTTFVRGIPSIDLKVLKTPSGKLMIASGGVGGVGVGVGMSGPNANGYKGCSTLLCVWKAYAVDKVNALRKGCGSKKGGPHRVPRPHGIKGGRPKPEGYGRPHHHRRPHHGVIGRILRSITLHVILPILVGIALGITASVVGMIVGHIAIFFWRLFFRRGERGQYCRVKQEEATEETDDEGKGFLENQGPPPVYQDAVVVTDEKTEQK